MCGRTFSQKPWVSTFAYVAIVAFLSACSTSALIQKNDPAFSEAQQRLERTAKIVDELKPSSPERTLFLQAESFYRYRYSPPPRGAESYFAEAAATITDFPGFQSLAGSFDLLDLRYRTPDSAPLLATGLGGLIVLSFDYTSSYEDAMHGVVQWNERAETEFNRTHPMAP